MARTTLEDRLIADGWHCFAGGIAAPEDTNSWVKYFDGPARPSISISPHGADRRRCVWHVWTWAVSPVRGHAHVGEFRRFSDAVRLAREIAETGNALTTV
jgi:hypothetical protein